MIRKSSKMSSSKMIAKKSSNGLVPRKKFLVPYILYKIFILKFCTDYGIMLDGQDLSDDLF